MTAPTDSLRFPRPATLQFALIATLLAAAATLCTLVGCVPSDEPPADAPPLSGGEPVDTSGLDPLRPLTRAEVDALPGVLAVTAEGNRAVALVNPITGRPFAYAGVGWAPRALVSAPDGRSVYVANSAGDRYGLGSLSVISIADRREVDRIELSPHGNLRGLAMTRSGTFLYIASELGRCVLEFNLLSRVVDRIFTLPRGVPAQLALDHTETRLFVTDPQTSTLWAIDLAGGRFTEARVGRAPLGLAISPDGLSVWVVNSDDGTISLVDPVTLADQGKLIAGRIPVAVAFTRDGQKALVVVTGESAIAVFGATSRARLQAIAVAGYPSAIAVATTGDRAFITSARDGVVQQLDTQTMQLVGSVIVGREPMGVAWVARR
jgi:YVTN family beta-propeller protein